MTEKCKIPIRSLHSGIHNTNLRSWQCSNGNVTADHLMYPLFITDLEHSCEEIASMPGVHRLDNNTVLEYLKPAIQNGLKSVLLFGVIESLDKDDVAKNADSDENPVVRLVPLLKKCYPQLTIACDVCLCAYTSHGHCGILNEDGSINNTKSIERIAQVATKYATVGADMVAPSDMMDGRVNAISTSLESADLRSKVTILSYAAKFSSCFYGPFRDAANSCPAFGDRKKYQLPGGSMGLAVRAAARDLEEGADMIMVKPAMPYLDVVRNIKQRFPEYPLFVYQVRKAGSVSEGKVSGEYAMLYYGAKGGAFDLKSAVFESLTSMRRAGADCIITYFTPDILRWIRCENSAI